MESHSGERVCVSAQVHACVHVCVGGGDETTEGDIIKAEKAKLMPGGVLLKDAGRMGSDAQDE